MNGSREKKLLLSTTKQEFIDKMNFHSEDEKNRCEIYLDLKGIAYHVVLANYIGLNRYGKIEYKKVQNLYKYDKRIRNTLYKFLAAFEEGVRAYISNRYNGNADGIKRLSEIIYNSIQSDSSLSKELENLDFFHLMEIVKNLEIKEKIELFGFVENLDSNLDAVRELRNTISHHRLLFVYEDFEFCVLGNGIQGNTLLINIKNLMQLIHPYYKAFFQNAINESCLDKRDSEFKFSLPDKAIIII